MAKRQKTIHKLGHSIISLVSLVLLVPLVFLVSQVVSLASTAPLPTQTVEIVSGSTVVEEVKLPDWNQISLSGLPPIEAGGSLGIEANSLSDYDLSRVWSAGMTPDQILKLGDVADWLAPQQFSVGQIAQISDLDLSGTSLASFPLLGEQSLAQLANAVPYLEQFPIAEITPIADLLSSQSDLVTTLSLAQLLSLSPELGALTLNEIDLASYALDAIPNIDSTLLADLANWQSSLIAEVPGLGQVPLGLMPNPIFAFGSAVARIDAIWSKAEAQRNNTISGSYKKGFSVSCESDCAHLELDDLENIGSEVRGSFEGKQWISGKYQEVSGGDGCLAFLNGGKEPTGRHPFGDGFKVAVWEIDQAKDSVDTALFFRITSFCGDSPYFIGPIPFISYHRDDVIFIGLLDGEGGSNSTPAVASIPEQVVANTALVQTGVVEPVRVTPEIVDADINPHNRRPCTGTEIKGISLDGLARSLLSLEPESIDDNWIGVYTCSEDGNCGRTLGKYKTMSHDPYLVKQVSRVPGGKAWLIKLSAGYEPTITEIMQYYPPIAQQQTIQAQIADLIEQASQEIDPTTQQLFRVERLVERVAQKWFGGSASVVDDDSSNLNLPLSLYESAVQVREYYQATGGNPDCGEL